MLALLDTKTSRGKNAYEYAQIRDEGACRLLRLFVSKAGLRPSDFLWGGGAHEYRKRFEEFLLYFNVSEVAFRLYSMRRGGASRLIDIIPMETLLVRGRWASVKAARVYLESARAEVITHKFSTATSKKILRHKRVVLRQAAF